MDNKAFDQAEVTLFIRKVKYRDETGAEKTAMALEHFASVKFAELGQEGGYITPINFFWDGALAPVDMMQDAVRFFLEELPAPQPDTLHDFSDI